jgi:hypothetical protein
LSKNTVYFTLITSFVTLISSPLTSSLYAQNTLSEEQIKEVEKDPVSIVEGCSYRVGLKLDPGKLCDSFSTYLHDKCERLDNLPDYCGPVAVYYPKRVIQKECISDTPLPNDILGIKTCYQYFIFNSTYSKLPLNLTLKYIYFNNINATVDAAFSLYNPNPVTKKLFSVAYIAAKQGNAVASGFLGDVKSNHTNCSDFCGYFIGPFETNDFTIPSQEVSVSAWNKIQTNTPYQINGIYKFNGSLGTEIKQFNFTS